MLQVEALRTQRLIYNKKKYLFQWAYSATPSMIKEVQYNHLASEGW